MVLLWFLSNTVYMICRDHKAMYMETISWRESLINDQRCRKCLRFHDSKLYFSTLNISLVKEYWVDVTKLSMQALDDIDRQNLSDTLDESDEIVR